jgi:hypothetical protein
VGGAFKGRLQRRASNWPSCQLNGHAAWVQCQPIRPSAWVQCQSYIGHTAWVQCQFFATLWSCTKCVVTSNVIWAVCAIAALSKKRAFPCSYLAICLGAVPPTRPSAWAQCQPTRPSAWVQCQLNRPDHLCVVPLLIMVRRTMSLNSP